MSQAPIGFCLESGRPLIYLCNRSQLVLYSGGEIGYLSLVEDLCVLCLFGLSNHWARAD